MKKRKQVTETPKAVVTTKSSAHRLYKDPDRKGSLVPDLSNYVSGEPPEMVLASLPSYVKEIRIKQPNSSKTLKKAGHDVAEGAFLTLWKMKDAVEDGLSIAVLILISLLNMVLDVLLPYLPCVPVIQMGSIPYIPETLRELLSALCGREQWKRKTKKKRGTKKGWQIKRPHCLELAIPLGALAPSIDMQSYIGGWAYVSGKKKNIWFPYRCTTVVFAPNLPKAVMEKFVVCSPLVVPCLCGNFSIKNRTIIKIDGEAFFSVDPSLLEQLKENKKLIQAEMAQFVRWFRQEEEQIDIWHRDIAQFRPRRMNGRFEQAEVSKEKEILAASLSLLKRFLHFASECAEWIPGGKANDILMEYWNLILPESAPKRNAPACQNAASYTDPDVFYRFLIEHFLPTFHRQIALPGQTVSSGIVGKIHKLGDEFHFITPRTDFLQAYRKKLDSQGDICFSDTEPHWEAAVQRKMTEAGIPLKGESRNPSTWRYAFYDKGLAPKEGQDKIECFGLPLSELPKGVRNTFERMFGVEFGGLTSSEQNGSAPNTGKAGENL